MIERAGRAAAGQSRPVSDVRGPAEYKRAMAAEMTVRALRAALDLGRERRRRDDTVTDKHHITLTVNGEVHEADVEPRLLLVHLLRDTFGLTGTHVGCDTSNCGACTIHVNGQSAKACTMLAVQADGADIKTIEGMASGATLHPLAAGLLGPARSPVRLLHARDDHAGGLAAATGTPSRTRRRSARASAATSAAARAT